MATLDAAVRLASELSAVSERPRQGNRTWLVQLNSVTDAILTAWLACAPASLADEYMKSRR